MAIADSSTTSVVEHSLPLKAKEALDEASLKLSRISGILDCLYTLATKDLSIGMDMDLSAGSLGKTLDLAIQQVDETQALLLEFSYD